MATTARSVLILIACITLASFIVEWFLPAPLAMGGCGAQSLYAVSQRLGLSVSSERVASLFVKSQSTHFAEIEDAANNLGLRTEGQWLTLRQLRASRPLGILHIDENHFVALVGYTTGGVWVADPLYVGEPRRVCWSDGDLRARWDGRILVVEKG